jgi:hypothetical protein
LRVSPNPYHCLCAAREVPPSPTFISVGARVPVTSLVPWGTVWIMYRSSLGAIDNWGSWNCSPEIRFCAKQSTAIDTRSAGLPVAAYGFGGVLGFRRKVWANSHVGFAYLASAISRRRSWRARNSRPPWTALLRSRFLV